jgi:hypothetical protein
LSGNYCGEPLSGNHCGEPHFLSGASCRPFRAGTRDMEGADALAALRRERLIGEPSLGSKPGKHICQKTPG